MIENIILFNKEEKLNRLRDRMIKNHVNYLANSPYHKDINWKAINPVLEKIVDYISEISDAPVFEKYFINEGQLEKKSHSVESYDLTFDGFIDSFIANVKDQDVIFYSLMVLDGSGSNRIIFRGSLYKSLERIKRENRDQRIDEIIG